MPRAVEPTPAQPAFAGATTPLLQQGQQQPAAVPSPYAPPANPGHLPAPAKVNDSVDVPAMAPVVVQTVMVPGQAAPQVMVMQAQAHPYAHRQTQSQNPGSRPNFPRMFLRELLLVLTGAECRRTTPSSPGSRVVRAEQSAEGPLTKIASCGD